MVENKSSYELPDQKTLDMNKEWVQELEDIFYSYKKYDVNKVRVQQFLDRRSDFLVYDFYTSNLSMDAMQYFQAGVTQKDVGLSKDYILLMRKLYSMLTEPSKQFFQEQFVKEWQYHEIDYTPYFETLVPRFREKIARLLDEIVKNPEEVDDDVQEELRWHLLFSPVTTLLDIFTRCLKNFEITGFCLNVCLKVPQLFFDRPLKIYHTEYETDRVESLMALVFRRLIFNKRWVDTSDEEWSNLEQLARVICSGQEPSLMSAWPLLEVVLCELYTQNRTPMISVEVLSEIAVKIVENFDNLKYATSARTKPAENVLLTPSIICFLLNIIVDENVSNTVIENCKMILKAIGQNMEQPFDAEAKSYLTSKVLKEFPWTLEFAISTWFKALEVEKRRIPSAVYKAINAEMKETFDERTFDIEESETVDQSINEEDEERCSTLSSESSVKTAISIDHKSDTAVDNLEMNQLHLSPKPKASVEAVKSCKPAFVAVIFEEIPPETDQNISVFEDPTIEVLTEYLDCIITMGVFDISCADELMRHSSVTFESSEQLEKVMKTAFEENFEIANAGPQRIKEISGKILEVFGSTSSESDHDRIASSIIELIPTEEYEKTGPRWSHDIKKSEIIQPLVIPVEATLESWPPAEYRYVAPGIKESRDSARHERLLRQQLATTKSLEMAQLHRDLWAENEKNMEHWTRPASPCNSSFFAESSVKPTTSSAYGNSSNFSRYAD
ncbi:Protein edg-1 [Caenorhabditis elegans]|uniref:Protein edg-1 n=1 Tax=Caenorhabditis elegans TaxID=6239 RepID=EDG1_CAEEL|nr:Protein edg-1 [Caenorhabditis elegans]Q17436.2 RecName: Full=Protein edg-1; AltName: Full=Enlarged deps-1 granule 1 [Caenorhabditis elegans]CAA97420.1 Protein edg-1 [Caenorhabditis elegans]|eukprot:NP_502130.1 Enlarged Deps-1 Granule phenotype [Caenorhabditis elegans]